MRSMSSGVLAANPARKCRDGGNRLFPFFLNDFRAMTSDDEAEHPSFKNVLPLSHPTRRLLANPRPFAEHSRGNLKDANERLENEE